MEILNDITNVIPTVVGWFVTIFEFLIPIAKSFYIDIHLVFWTAIGIPEWIINAVSIGIPAFFTIRKIISIINDIIPF